MTPPAATLLLTLTVELAAFAALWGLSLRWRNASIVDPFWGSGFVLAAATVAGAKAPHSWRAWCLVALTAIWGLRLSAHLLRRNFGYGEDRRYAAMRDHHGANFWWISLFTVFLLQAVILWVISLPVQIAVLTDSPVPFGLLDAAGLAIWALGLFFETVGDWQLARFQSDPANRGRVMDRGLWKYTRHPNYFGDFCVWWGLYLIASAGQAGWTVFSPLLMSFLLIRVSGVSLLERTILSRRPGYAAYQARTSAFFPWPPADRAPGAGSDQ